MSTERVALVREVPIASTSMPLMDGTASYGSGNSYARGNHRHPTDTTRQEALTPAQLENIAAVPNKVDKVVGKGLSTEDYTYADKTKLGNLKPYTIPYGALNSTSTATVMTVTVSPPVTALEDGLCVLVKNGVVTSAANFTINVNGLGAKPVYSSMAAATRETTVFAKGYTVMLFYDSTRVSGGCWVFYRGYDSDTDILAYRIRGASASLTASVEGHKGRLWFTSANGAHVVPSNTSTVEDATSARAVCTLPIDPFGHIWYYSTSGGVVPQGGALSPTYAYLQYAYGIGYAFNDGALSLTANTPVYVKCIPQSDGSAILQGIVQNLPSYQDGRIYIFLGIAYDATHVEMFTDHPVYWHNGTKIGLWTGSPTPSATDIYYKLDDGGSGSDSSSSSSDTINLEDRTINRFRNDHGRDRLTLVFPPAVASGGNVFARDFILDIDNSNSMSDLMLEVYGLGGYVALRIPETTTLADITTIEAGKVARLYFSEAAPENWMSMFAMHRLDFTSILLPEGSSSLDSSGSASASSGSSSGSSGSGGSPGSDSGSSS